MIRIDEGEIRGHLSELVRGTVEETLNGLLDAEADEMCQAQRYERSPERVDTRAGHYRRKLQTQVGEVELKMPKLRRQTFETAIIERYHFIASVRSNYFSVVDRDTFDTWLDSLPMALKLAKPGLNRYILDQGWSEF